MEIQINSAGIDLDCNGHLRSNKLYFTQYCFGGLKIERERSYTTGEIPFPDDVLKMF